MNKKNNSLRYVENYYYDLRNPLGRGDEAIVYLATNKYDGSKFALKVIPHPKTQIQRSEEIVKEIAQLQTIRNKYIVCFFEAMQTLNNIYFVHELCNGGSLRFFIPKNEGMSPLESCTILKQIASAFLYLRQVEKGGENEFVNILHRNLKPECIFFHEAKVKIGGFGFAKFNDVIKDTTQCFQTIVKASTYSAPEVIGGNKYNSSCDVWSAGIIFYEMLHGKTPWKGNSNSDLLRKIKSEKLSIRAELDDDIANLLKRMLQLNGDDRISWNEIYEHKALKRILLD